MSWNRKPVSKFSKRRKSCQLSVGGGVARKLWGYASTVQKRERKTGKCVFDTPAGSWLRARQCSGAFWPFGRSFVRWFVPGIYVVVRWRSQNASARYVFAPLSLLIGVTRAERTQQWVRQVDAIRAIQRRTFASTPPERILFLDDHRSVRF